MNIMNKNYKSFLFDLGLLLFFHCRDQTFVCIVILYNSGSYLIISTKAQFFKYILIPYFHHCHSLRMITWKGDKKDKTFGTSRLFNILGASLDAYYGIFYLTIAVIKIHTKLNYHSLYSILNLIG